VIRRREKHRNVTELSAHAAKSVEAIPKERIRSFASASKVHVSYGKSPLRATSSFPTLLHWRGKCRRIQPSSLPQTAPNLVNTGVYNPELRWTFRRPSNHFSSILRRSYGRVLPQLLLALLPPIVRAVLSEEFTAQHSVGACCFLDLRVIHTA